MKKEKDAIAVNISDYDYYWHTVFANERVVLTDEERDILWGKYDRVFFRYYRYYYSRPHEKDFATNREYLEARREYKEQLNRMVARMNLYTMLLVGADPNLPEFKNLAKCLNVKLIRNLGTKYSEWMKEHGAVENK